MTGAGGSLNHNGGFSGIRPRDDLPPSEPNEHEHEDAGHDTSRSTSYSFTQNSHSRQPPARIETSEGPVWPEK